MDHPEMRGSRGGYTIVYTEWARENNRCLKHPDRAAAPATPEEVKNHTIIRSTLACLECWPKKLQRLRSTARRRHREASTPFNERGYYGPQRLEWRRRWTIMRCAKTRPLCEHACCAYCQIPISRGYDCDDREAPWCEDHVLPLAREGRDVSDNRVPSCAYCNSSKGKKLLWSEWTPRNPSNTLLKYFPKPT